MPLSNGADRGGQTRQSTDPAHILFVDDAPSDVELAVRQLYSGGLEFTWARVDSGPALLDALKTRCPDLIISDCAIPRFSGPEALSLSIRHDPEFPFLILTGSRNEEAAVDCLKAGAWDYLLKEHAFRLPFAVRAALSRKRALVEASRAREALLESERRYRPLAEERSRLEAGLVQAQKMEAVGRLAGGVSHDFNNLLTGILGFCDLLLTSMPPGSPYRADVDQIQAIAMRASTLTRQLLAFSRKQRLRHVPLNLTTLVSDLRASLRAVVSEKIELVWELSPDLDDIEGDPGQIEQAIYALVANAGDAMADGGRLTVRTGQVTLDEAFVGSHAGARTGPYVAISVSDSGTGIDPKVLPLVFEPFLTTKAPGQGTGLGLAAVYGIVKQSGGYVAAESEVGRGSTFTMYFPVSGGAVASTTPAQTHSTAKAHGTPTILLVEDEEGLRVLLRRVLEGYGYTVLAAIDGNEAVARWKDDAGSIDLLLTDIVMPGRSGLDVARLFRESSPALHVMLMSGYTDPELFKGMVLDDRTSIIQKPFLPRVLGEQIRRLLDLQLPDQPSSHS